MQIEQNQPDSDSPEKTADPAFPVTLVESLADRSPLFWFVDVVNMALVLILLLIGAAFLDGVLTGPLDDRLWTIGLMQVGMLAYLVGVQPTLGRLRNDAIAALRPLVSLNDDDLRRLLTEAALFNRRREVLAGILGAVCGLLLIQPWAGDVFSSFWLKLYGVLLVGLLYGVVGWFAYSSLAGMRLFDKLHNHASDLNVFELKSLEPIAHWSLGIALTYIVGMTFGLLFSLPYFSFGIEFAIGYGSSILVTVVVFFLNMVSTHRIMAAAKKRELEMVRGNLTRASQALHRCVVEDELDMDTLPTFVGAWLAYQKQVEAVSEWPYTTTIIRNLALSLLLPGVAAFAQGLLSQVLGGFMPPS